MVRGRVEVPSRYDRMAKGAGAVRGVARDRRDVTNRKPTGPVGRVDDGPPCPNEPASQGVPPETPSTRRFTINSYNNQIP